MRATPSHTTLSGQILADRYRIERLLGRGGFADVYLAHHLEIESLRVAVKVLHGAHLGRNGILERFKREASLLAMLRNRHTVRLIDFGFTATEAPFLVMEYVDGAPLDRVIRASAPLRETDTARLGIHVLKALAEAHALGIVHRDLKPANVLMIREPGERHAVARVLDFGIAKVMGDPQVKVTAAQMERIAHASTGTDQVFCTPLYAAPELLLGSPDFRTDLYALGLVMAEMLDGKPPYLDVDCSLDNSPHLLSAPVPIGPVAASSALGPLIRTAVAKRLDERYQTAEEMLDALQDVYSRIRLPANTEIPLDVLPPPPVDEGGIIELRASQFVPLLDEPTRAVMASTIFTQLPPYLPALEHDAPMVSGFRGALEKTTRVAAEGPRTLRARRGRKVVGGLVAGAVVVTLAAIAVTQAPGRAADPVEPPTLIVPTSVALPARVPAPQAEAPSENNTAEPTPKPVEVITPESTAIWAARANIDNARWDARSSIVRVRTTAAARLLVNGEEAAVLVPDGDGWVLPANTAIPITRPIQLSLVSSGLVYTHEVLDFGPVDLSVDLQALGQQGTPAESEPPPTRRRSRRSRAEAPSDDSNNSGTSLLGPSIAPRTQ